MLFFFNNRCQGSYLEQPMKDMHTLLTENFSKKPPMHHAIKAEIERIKAILFERNFTLPMVEQGPDVEVNTYTEGIRCFATKRPWILRACVEDVPGDTGLVVGKDVNSLNFRCTRLFGKSWCAVFLDPEDTDLDWWDFIIDQLLLYHWPKSYWGYVLFACPRMTKWGTIRYWHRDILFIEEEGGLRRLRGLTSEELYPWPVTGIQLSEN